MKRSIPAICALFVLTVTGGDAAPKPPPVRFEPGFGVPGFRIRLRGRGLDAPGLEAAIGGAIAGVSSLAPTVAVVKVPEGAHTGPLTIHGPGETPRTLGILTVTPVVTGHLDVPAGMNARAYRVVSPFGSSEVSDTGEFRVPVLETGNTWLWAVTDDPDVPFQTLATGSDESPRSRVRRSRWAEVPSRATSTATGR